MFIKYALDFFSAFKERQRRGQNFESKNPPASAFAFRLHGGGCASGT